MAIIPQYVNREQLTKEGPLVTKNVSEEVRLGEGRAMQQQAETLANLGEQIRKVDAANSTSKAEVERVNLEAQDEAKIKTMSAPEAEKYVEQSSQKRTQELAKKYFSDPVARQDYLRKAQVQDASYVIQQKANIAKRVVGERRVLTFRDKELAVSNGINADSDQARAAAEQQLVNVVSNPANQDIFTPEEQYKLIEDGRKEIARGIKDREELKAKQAKEIQLARDFARDQRENDLIKKRVDEQLTIEEVRQAMDGDNPIDAKVGQSLINSLKSPKTVAAKTDYNVYGKIMADIIDPKKTATEIKATINYAFAKGELSRQDYKSLLYTKQQGQEPIFTKASQEEIAKSNPAAAVWLAIKNNFSSPTDRGEVMSRVVEKLATGGIPLRDMAQVTGVIKDVTKDQMRRLHSWMLTIPKGGTQVMDAEGNMSHITEDGDLEDGE